MREQEKAAELWRPKAETLKRRAELWMEQPSGTAWRTVLSPLAQEQAEQPFEVVALLKYAATAGGGRWEFLMTVQSTGRPEGQIRGWPESLTGQFYKSLWTTALLSCGRELLYEELKVWAQTQMPLVEVRPMEGPGLDAVPLSEMEGLYCRLNGERIGVGINAFGVLLPEASCGGWFAVCAKEDSAAPSEGEDCPAGSGCAFCARYAGCKKIQKTAKRQKGR